MTSLLNINCIKVKEGWCNGFITLLILGHLILVLDLWPNWLCDKSRLDKWHFDILYIPYTFKKIKALSCIFFMTGYRGNSQGTWRAWLHLWKTWLCISQRQRQTCDVLGESYRTLCLTINQSQLNALTSNHGYHWMVTMATIHLYYTCTWIAFCCAWVLLCHDVMFYVAAAVDNL